MADQLTEEQVAKYKATFETFDKNGNGQLSMEELQAVLDSLGQNPRTPEFWDAVKKADADHDMSISFPEFLNLMAKGAEGYNSDWELRTAFLAFDEDGSGTIDTEELRDTLRSLGEKLTEEDVGEMVKEADKDGDGYINLNEFKAMMVQNDVAAFQLIRGLKALKYKACSTPGGTSM